ncbi:MAG TPA: TetR/AcrR family transcriptional regulator [Frankiaceae bacterium]|nr:TetR/AcrR family transcriptional regulator [Frankiaceae bacterium]
MTSAAPSRSQRAEAAILSATRELLARGGVRELTVEGVAARSGVAKTTIYRRWRSKDELALAVVIDMVQTVVAVPELADTRSELIAFVGGAVRVLGKTLMGPVMQGLVPELATDSELARSFRDRVVVLRLHEVERLLRRGIERGEIRADVDVGLTHELLFGAVYYRLFLSGQPLDRKLAERIVDAVLPGLRKPPGRTRGAQQPSA